MMFKYPLVFFIVLVFSLSCNNGAPKTVETEIAPKIQPEAQKVEKKERKKSILFYGDSLTAGYGLEEEEAFPALIQDRIDSLGLDYEVINAGLSGETSAGGKGRIEWVLNRPVDVFVLELGANDMLRGLSIEETDKNLKAILDKVNELSPDAKIVIAGMEAPANMGPEYSAQFKNIFASLATDYKAALIPFLLEGLMGSPELSIGDNKHPNAEGQKIVRENVWRIIQPLLI